MFKPPKHHLIRTEGKRAIDTAWQKNPLSLEEFNDRIADHKTIGLVCNGDIVVIDIDTDKYLNDLNEATVSKLLEWELPPTLMIETPSGGYHYFFRKPDDVTLKRHPKAYGTDDTEGKGGIDLLGESGYVNLTARSNGPANKRWSHYDESQIAELPDNVLEDWLAKLEEKASGTLSDDGISDLFAGNRNNALASVAGRYRAMGLNAQEIELLLQDENQRRCQPPLPVAEVRAIAHSIGKYETAYDEEAERSRNGALPFETITQLRTRAAEMSVPEVICGPFQSGTWGIIAGCPGVGKSMFTTALARAMTMGVELGEWRSPKKRRVAIIDAEMTPNEIDPRVPGEVSDRLTYCTLDLLDRNNRVPFSLGNTTDQAGLMAACLDADVIIIDNIEYTLEPAPNRDIFHPETWAQVAPLTRWAKASNKLLILVDHTNASGNVQGTLSKQRGASFVAVIEPEFRENAALCFSVAFPKMRYQVGPGMKAKATWWLDEHGWHQEKQMNIKDEIIELIRDGLTPAQILKEVDCTRAFVYRVYKQNKHLKSET